MAKKWTVYDVPHLRNDLIDSLALAQKNMSLAKDMFLSANIQNQADTVDFHLKSVTAQREALVRDDVEMHYISKSMCSLIGDMSKDLPEWTAKQAIPSDRGFLVFETPVQEHVYATDKYTTETPVRGIFWHKKEFGLVEIVFLTGKDNPKVVEDADGDLIFKTGVIYFNENALQGEGRLADDVKSNDNIIKIQEFDRNEQYNRSVALVGATWLLMSQQKIAEVSDTRVPMKRSKTRQSSSESRIDDRSVIVHERSLARKSASGQYIQDQENKRSGKSNRVYTHQWWVRGHWRQQACGPKRAERKPVYIEPHIAGPSDVDNTKPRVTRWRD